MGEVSGSAARAWHRRRRDQRLGYSALALGAGGFVLVLAGTLLVTEVVVPSIVGEDPPSQEVVPASELAPVEGQDPALDDTPEAAAPVEVAEGSVLVPVADPGTQASPGGGAPAPESPAQPAPQPAPAPQPEPPAPAPQPEGPVGSLVDPVVEGVAQTASGLTGGATGPLTTPVVTVVDDLTDTVDGLLGGLLGGSR